MSTEGAKAYTGEKRQHVAAVTRQLICAGTSREDVLKALGCGSFMQQRNRAQVPKGEQWLPQENGFVVR